MQNIQFEPVQFGAAEAERITGMSQATERNNRRQGYLEAPSGRARHQGHGLALRLVMAVLAERGLGPAKGHPIAAAAAALIYRFALRQPGAIAGIKADSPLTGPGPKRFLVAYGDGIIQTFDDPISAFDNSDAGAATVVDLASMGKVLASRAGGPLAIASVTRSL